MFRKNTDLVRRLKCKFYTQRLIFDKIDMNYYAMSTKSMSMVNLCMLFLNESRNRYEYQEQNVM